MILETEKWKIIGDLTLYLSNKSNDAYLVNEMGLNRRELRELGKKVIDYKRCQSVVNEFSLFVQPDLTLQVEYEGKKWLVKNNIGTDYVGFILSQASIKQGAIEGTFEAISCARYPSLVFFVSQEMKEYDSCFNEYLREMNLSLMKKTKKWIPGHRYDSAKDTYFYLGEWEVNYEGDLFASSYSGNKRKVHLVSTSIRDCTTIGDVLKKYPMQFGDRVIKPLDTLPTMVDGGEVLEPDNAIDWSEVFKERVGEGRLVDAMSALYFMDNVDSETKQIIEKAYNDTLLRVLVTYLKSNSPRSIEGGNIEQALRLTCVALNPYNSTASQYYEGFLLALGIDIRDITKKAMKNFSMSTYLFSDFDKYLLHYKDYFRFHDVDRSNLVVSQRKKTADYNTPKAQKLEDALGNSPELIVVLKDMVSDVITETAYDVSSFQIINLGNVKEYIRTTITLEDIVKREKGSSGMSKSLKNEIMNTKFQSIVIEFDKNSQLE